MNRPLKIITNILEVILAIPLIGGVIIISFGWYPLLIMLALHIVTLILAKQNNDKMLGSALGIFTSCLGWIPFLGWLMHVITAIVLLVENITYKKKNSYIES